MEYLPTERNVDVAFSNVRWALHEAGMQLQSGETLDVGFLTCLSC